MGGIEKVHVEPITEARNAEIPSELSRFVGYRYIHPGFFSTPSCQELPPGHRPSDEVYRHLAEE